MGKVADIGKIAIFVGFVMLVGYYILLSVTADKQDDTSSTGTVVESKELIAVDEREDTQQGIMSSITGLFASKKEQEDVDMEQDRRVNAQIDAMTKENELMDAEIDEIFQQEDEMWDKMMKEDELMEAEIEEMYKKIELTDAEINAMEQKDKLMEDDSVLSLKQKILGRVGTSKEPVAQTQVVNTDIKKLDDFPKTVSTWGKTLNPSGDIPNGRYKAVFFNTETQKVGQTIVQDTISAAGAYNIAGIKSEDFGAYFVGNINVTEKGLYEFYGTSGWSTTRLILDGRVIPNKTTLELAAGSYTLEAEHINNWHTVDFTAGFLKPVKEIDMQTAKQVLKDVRNIPNLKTWYAGAYESSTHSIDISLSPSNTPVALVLSSYGSIEWKINRNNVDLRAIIFSSLEEGASVSGVGDVPIYSMAYRDIPNLYKPLPDCYDAGGMFHCEGGLDEFEDLMKVTTDLLGNVPAGFAGKYSTTNFTLPERLLDAQEYKKIQDEKNKTLDTKKETESKKSFDNMFN